MFTSKSALNVFPGAVLGVSQVVGTCWSEMELGACSHISERGLVLVNLIASFVLLPLVPGEPVGGMA